MGNSGSSDAALKVPNYDQGKVYMFNFPCVTGCVTSSPFALKLETWLRLKQIPHVTIRSANHRSKKGQIPFIEYNGTEYNESGRVIQFLSKEFNKEDALTPEQQGLARAIAVGLDNRTGQSYAYFRYVERPLEMLLLMKLIPPIMARPAALAMPALVKRRLVSHGIGRNSPAEIYQIGFEDLLALSHLLGDKKFIFGDQMTTVDCCAFAHLAQILYLPIDYPHKSFILENAQNLSDYAARVKEAVWPDWDRVCTDDGAQ